MEGIKFAGDYIDTAPEERYIDEQMRALVKRGVGRSQFSQAIDNLKALEHLANGIVPALAQVALNDRDTWRQRKAIEALGEMRMRQVSVGISAIAQTLLRTRDPEIGKAAEDSFVKLLPAVDRGLMLSGCAMLLLQMHESGNKRVATAIESAWAACGLTKDAVVNENEPNKLRLAKERMEQRYANARAYEAMREATDPEYRKRKQEGLERSRAWRQAQWEHDQAAWGKILQSEQGPPKTDTGAMWRKWVDKDIERVRQQHERDYAAGRRASPQ